MYDIEKISEFVGKTYTCSISTDEPSLKWTEHYDVELLDLVSTSGLLKIVHGCGNRLLSDFETEDLVSVVVETSLKHLAPVKMNEEVTVYIKIESFKEENGVRFSGTVAQDGLTTATFTFVRRFISIDFLRRSV